MKSKKIVLLSIIAALLLVLTLSVSAAEEPAVDLSFTMEPSSSVVDAGTEFFVDLGIDNNSGFAAVRVEIEYDSAYVDFNVKDWGKAAENFSNVDVKLDAVASKVVVTIGSVADAIEKKAPIQKAVGDVASLKFTAKAGVEEITTFTLSLNKYFVFDNEYNVGEKSDYVLAETTVLEDIRLVDRATHIHTIEAAKGQPATCTTAGYDDYEYCTYCDYTTRLDVEALNHDIVKHDAKAPTCVDKGWNAYETCSRCDEYTTYEELAATGVHTEETFEKNGVKCAVCGAVLVEPSASLTWLWIVLAVVAVLAIGGGVAAFLLTKKKSK